MLDEGFGAACEFAGRRARVVAYVEREASAAATIMGRMEEQSLERAPIWCGNLEDLPIADLEILGRVDCIVGGIPCQPFSIAGSQRGLADERWLWPIMRELARCVGARWIAIENVGGFIRAGLLPVVDDFAESGWAAEWLHLRASDVGASHRRERIFVLANDSRRGLRELRAPSRGSGQPECSGEKLAHAKHDGRGQRWAALDDDRSNALGNEPDRLDTGMGNAKSYDGRSELPSREATGSGRARPARASVDVADAERESNRAEQRQESGSQSRRRKGEENGSMLGEPGETVADASRPGQQGVERRGAHDKPGATPRGPACQRGSLPIFAPGPNDASWEEILTSRPHLTPAAEPGLCVVVDGLAYPLDSDRTDALRAAGNGVVALQAAVAFTELFRRFDEG